MTRLGNRLPTALWRVVSTGAKLDYWERASKNYTSEQHAQNRANRMRRDGAKDVRVMRADLTWTDVTDA